MSLDGMWKVPTPAENRVFETLVVHVLADKGFDQFSDSVFGSIGAGISQTE